MKFKNLHFAYIIVAILGIVTLTSNSTGKMGVYTAGCGSAAGCHGGDSNLTVISMEFDGNKNVKTYTPSKKYAVNLSFQNSKFTGNPYARAGFNLNFSSGTLTNTPIGTKLIGKELLHTTPKALTTSDASVTFSFDWTAPEKSTGTVTINIAGNMVNGTGMATGDWPNTKIISLKEDAGSAIMTVNDLSINLYPNQSSDYIIISGDDLTSVKNISAVSMSGKRFSLPIIYSKSDQIRLNTGGLSKGKYFVQIQLGDRTSSLPLLID